jgi:protein-L-isoaspartate(D-aspartate) O-methyltransferase
MKLPRRSILPTLLLLPMLLLPAAESETKFTAAREKMVREQILQRGITDPRILNVFRKVERHLFVSPAYLPAEAYGDFPLAIEENQTISQPYIVAIMTYAIAPEKHKKVLEIGTGSGYQAAILAELVQEVYTIEINDKLAGHSKKLLGDLGYRNIHCRAGNGYLGWPEAAPFDGIIVTCAPDDIPPALIGQLAVGGRMVIPISYSSNVQDLLLVEKLANGKLKKTDMIPVLFVPMIRVNNAR